MNATARRATALGRWASLGGILYVVLWIVGSVISFSGTPDNDAPPGEVIDYYADSGHRVKLFVGWILVMLGVFFFLWFLARLRDVVGWLDGGLLAFLTLIGGTVYAATTTVAISVLVAIRGMSDDTFRDQVYPPLIHAANDTGYVVHAAGGVGAGAMMIAASLAALWAGRLAAGVAWVGVALGVIALFSIAFFPQFAIPLWLIGASIVLWHVAVPEREAVTAT